MIHPHLAYSMQLRPPRLKQSLIELNKRYIKKQQQKKINHDKSFHSRSNTIKHASNSERDTAKEQTQDNFVRD